MTVSKYRLILFSALEEGGVVEILLPNPKAAKRFREALYKERLSFKKTKSQDGTSPWDKFSIGISGSKVIIDTCPAEPIVAADIEILQSSEPPPSHGGYRPKKPESG